jgi:hypothetical protein
MRRRVENYPVRRIWKDGSIAPILPVGTVIHRPVDVEGGEVYFRPVSFKMGRGSGERVTKIVLNRRGFHEPELCGIDSTRGVVGLFRDGTFKGWDYAVVVGQSSAFEKPGLSGLVYLEARTCEDRDAYLEWRLACQESAPRLEDKIVQTMAFPIELGLIRSVLHWTPQFDNGNLLFENVRICEECDGS